MEDLTGKQFGVYRLVSRCGEGGMATVYKAYQPSMDRYVAVKVLPRFHSADPEFLGRFEQEAKALAQLQHPHILPVYDYGESDGYTYFVMPLMQDGNLAELLKAKQLPLDQIRRVISQVGSALEFAHSRGFIHRDVKPSNILLDASGNCMLMDFGIAKIIEGSKEFTRTGGILGTPAYMSPEQGSGVKQVDHKSDIYSLGIILYEMVTGRPPFEAETPVAIIFKHVHDPLPPPSSLRPDVPEDIERVILKSLAKEPEDRYKTVKDMVDALSGAVTATLAKHSLEVDLPPTVSRAIPDVPSAPPEVPVPESVAEERQEGGAPDRVGAARGSPASLTQNRYFRPVLVLVAAVALILLGVWLTRSGILPSAEPTEAEATEAVVGAVIETPAATSTSAPVVVPTTAPVIQAPVASATPRPTLEPAYPVVPTIEVPGLGLGFDTIYYLGFDPSIPPFDNLLVRQAVASAIDKDSLVETFSELNPNGRFLAATSFTPPDVIGLDLNDVGYPFNPDRARQFMAEAGYPDGEGFPTITLRYRGVANWEQMAREVSEDLNEVLGINANFLVHEVRPPDLPSFYILGWRADYIDPHNFLYDAFCGSYNRDLIESGEYWDIVAVIHAEKDLSARKSLILEFSDVFCNSGWNPRFDFDLEYRTLLDQAMDEEDYTKAQMLYAQADTILVERNIFVVPMYYGSWDE